MKRIIIAVLGAFVLLFGVGLATAGPAAAVQTNTITVCGYTYDGAIDFSRPGNGNVTFNWWNITARSGAGLPMEYRVRWFSPSGVVLYDTGYVGSYNGNPGGNPGVTRYFPKPGSAGTVTINVGKAGDGCATGAMNYSIPGG